MRPLIIYYSRTGTTRKLVHAISERYPADLYELKDKTFRKGVFGYIRSIFDAVKRRETVIARPRHVPSRYPLVILAMPVWAGTLPPAMRTYILRHLKNPGRVAFITTHGGKGQEKIFGELESLTGQKPVATGQVVRRDFVRQKDRFKQELDAFINSLSY